MNKIFKVKRNSLGQSVVCSEIATSRSKGRVIASALAFAVAGTVAGQAQAVDSTYIDTANTATLQGLYEDDLNRLYAEAGEENEYLKLIIDSAITSDAIADEVAENRARIEDNRGKIANKADTETVLTLLGTQEKNTQETFADVLNQISTKADTETVDTIKRDLSAENNRINDLNTQVANKADKADVDAALATKANQSTVDALKQADTYLASLAGTNQGNIAKLQTEVANKADTETVLTLLGTQEKNTQETFADVLNQISTKADTETVDTIKRDLSAENNRINDLNTQVANKADKADVAGKADQATVDALTTASNVLIDEVAQNRADIIDTINYANAIADAADQDRAENEANIVELTGYVNSVAEATDKNSIDIAANANDIVELAKNAAASDEQIDRNTNAVINLATATDVLIDEIADNTNDIGKLAVISETTVDEVANNRAQIKDNHGKITENKQALAKKADKSVVDAMRNFDTYLASLAGTNQGKINKLETAVADKADQATVDALTTASHVLIDEIADNTNDIGKLAVISETTVDEVANNRAQIRDNKAAITKNQADIATLISRTPAAVDLQPINDKIGALDNSLNDKINKLDDKLSAGVAGAVAIAMMPAPAAGSHYITGGTGFYNGENAVAVGLTGASETGTFTYKIGGSVNSSGSGTFGAGAGYRWK